MDYSKLMENWTRWSTRVGLADVYATENQDLTEVFFHSDDNSVYLRCVGGRWIVDTVNDRGRRLNDIADFSDFSLAEKFLIWRWASFARSAVGARQLGAEFQDMGRMADVEFRPGDRPYFTELVTAEGSAVVSDAHSIVFSHVMSMSIDEIESLVSQGI
ncbi:MAG: hypothetical protein WCE30_03225 [Mycobacterium sp.]